MKNLTVNTDTLTKKEKTIMEFLLDEYNSLYDGLEETEGETEEDSFVKHYCDQTGYIMANVENILKRQDLSTKSAITQKQLNSLIEFINKEHNHSADDINPETTCHASYIEGVVNEARYFASAICNILELHPDTLKDKKNEIDEDENEIF